MVVIDRTACVLIGSAFIRGTVPTTLSIDHSYRSQRSIAVYLSAGLFSAKNMKASGEKIGPGFHLMNRNS